MFDLSLFRTFFLWNHSTLVLLFALALVIHLPLETVSSPSLPALKMFRVLPGSSFSLFPFHAIHPCQGQDCGEVNKAFRAQNWRMYSLLVCTSTLLPYLPCLPHPSTALALSTQFSEHSLLSGTILSDTIPMFTSWIIIHMVVTTVILQWVPNIHHWPDTSSGFQIPNCTL